MSLIRINLTVLVLGLFVFTGCNFGSDSNSESETSAFKGVWGLNPGSNRSGEPDWFIHFLDNGEFFISNLQDGGQVRVTGSYSVAGGKLVGPFTNPGVGEGRVEARLDGEFMPLDFIEYWHTPHKVVPYTGVKRN
jgi:hypothetical protein